ncbi:MAG: hypothetical protein JNM41_03580 [Flavipsychrobacter sp.]|nr:hypothetical protein [Flavipsychrobacter sp.]
MPAQFASHCFPKPAHYFSLSSHLPAGRQASAHPECFRDKGRIEIKSSYILFTHISCNIRTSYNQYGNGAKGKSMIVRFV